ncbi:hypothetical protein OG535_32305 [Kitasatospora sp. NBC_00085]|uniref:hypothetical protein n=1 Tax=unclassified Kitasatospora TaxID=2633591 RepID=UPI0032500502
MIASPRPAGAADVGGATADVSGAAAAADTPREPVAGSYLSLLAEDPFEERIGGSVVLCRRAGPVWPRRSRRRTARCT